jgi:putative transposase
MIDYFEHKRKSYIEIGEIFFVTATINGWKHLLKDDTYKDIIIDSMKWLSDEGKWDVFAFVIMPNHIHTIIRTKALNGKETAQGSFLKYTAHEFRKKLKFEGNNLLAPYLVHARNKTHEFWQRDTLAVHLYSSEVAYQKLNYIHNNPLAEHWQLVTDPCDYKYSSAIYYEKCVVNYPFLKDLREEL